MLFDDEGQRAAIAAQFGREAKAWGKRTPKREGDPVRTWDGRLVALGGEDFDEEVCRAIRAKVEQNPDVAAALLATGRLPLAHYYVMWGRPLAPRGERGVLVACLSALRDRLREAAADTERVAKPANAD
jgi:hypothetical protein